jgi:hypothetical protein
LWPTIRALLLSLPLIAAVSGCRTTKSAAVHTEYKYVYQRDSVYIDCTDTIYFEKVGDTVRIREKITEKSYYYTIYRDTLRNSDTLIVKDTVVMQSHCKKNGGKWFAAGFIIGILIIFAAWILKKIYLR